MKSTIAAVLGLLFLFLMLVLPCCYGRPPNGVENAIPDAQPEVMDNARRAFSW